jgi:hypothetical protein
MDLGWITLIGGTARNEKETKKKWDIFVPPRDPRSKSSKSDFLK